LFCNGGIGKEEEPIAPFTRNGPQQQTRATDTRDSI